MPVHPKAAQPLAWGPEATAIRGPALGQKIDSELGWATWKERLGGSPETGVHSSSIIEGHGD